nr:cytochrome P450 1A1-like isoform X2 [Zootoca vivipara]
MNFSAEDVSFSKVTIAFFTVASILISIRIFMKSKQPRPPGPWSLPIVGNLLHLGEHPYVSFDRMRKKYGDVFQIKLGMVPVVVVNGLDAVRQVLLRDGESFAARPDMHTFSFFADGESLSFSVKYGESWKLQKQIASKALRSLTKSEATSSTCSCLLEEHVCAEALELVKTFMELSKQADSFDPADSTTCAVANVVCALCFNKRYDHDDEEFLCMLKNHLRDIMDALISVGNEKREDGKGPALSHKKIIVTVNDIFGAGFATLSVCLQWIFLYLISNPEIQTKIQEEIDAKIGERPPRFEDRKVLHYTEAFLHEIFRHTSFLPFTIPHCTTKDATLNGYHIPAKTCIFVNMYQVNHDESLWEDPYLFKPHRFLNENGELNKSLAEKVLIFGMGIRKCLGEEVARNEVFVILTTILQQLRLEKPPEDHLDLNPIYGLSMAPKPYRIKVLLRT